MAFFFNQALSGRSSSLRLVSRQRNGRPVHGKAAVVFSSRYQIKLAGLEKFHPFDVQKYARIYKKLITEGDCESSDVYVPGPILEEDILLLHTAKFLENLKKSGNIADYLEAQQLKILPQWVLDDGVLKPFRYAAGGTLLASRLALKHGIGFNLSGGFHHAKPDTGEGFCIYADIPITIRVLQKETLINKALVIDVDAHQGNGTAECFKGDDSVFSFSIHQEELYPFPKAKSDLDIAVSGGTGDEDYLNLLRNNMEITFSRFQPDIIFLVAGCDTLASDPLTDLNMTAEGVIHRDWMITREALRRNIPIVMTLAGGYSKDAWLTQYRSIKYILEKIKDQQPAT